MAIGIAGPLKTPINVDQGALIDKRSGRAKKVSAKLRRVIRGLLEGKYRTQIAAAAGEGLSEDYVQRALYQPHVRVFVEAQISTSLATGKLRAAGRLVELLDAKSEHVSLDAAELALGIGGVRPASQPSVNNTFIGNVVVPGYVIDLTDTGQPPVVDVTCLPLPNLDLGKGNRTPQQILEDGRRPVPVGPLTVGLKHG